MQSLSKILSFANIFKLASAVWWNDPVQDQKGGNLPDSFWIKFVEMCKRLGVNPHELAAVINNESGFNASARNFAAGPNKPPVAQGLTQFIKNTAVRGFGMSEDLWQQYYKLSAEEQLPWVEKYFQGKAKGKDAGDLYLMNFGGFKNPDGSIYASKAAQEAFKKTHPDAVFQNSNYQQKAIEQNPGLADAVGRIMPEKIRASAKRGLPAAIAQKIDAAIQTTAGKPVPPFMPPSNQPKYPHSGQPTANQDRAVVQQPNAHLEAKQIETQLGPLENTLWFQ